MMTSTLPLVTIAVVTLEQGLLVVMLKSSLNKHDTTAIVTSGKVEVIIKQKRYYSNSY
jgi:hypothetical protein